LIAALVRQINASLYPKLLLKHQKKIAKRIMKNHSSPNMVIISKNESRVSFEKD